MRLCLLMITCVLFAAVSARAAETVDESLGTGEVMAFGLNTYLVYLEISELAEDRPNWVLATSGIVVGAATLALKDYDGTLFGDLFTGIAASDLLLGGILLYRNRRVEPVAFGPIILATQSSTRLGMGLSFRF